MTSRLKGLYGTLTGEVVTVLTIALTFKDGSPGAILKNRLAVGLVLLVPGAMCLVCREAMLTCCVRLGDLMRFSHGERDDRTMQQVTSLGRWAFFTGLAILLASAGLFAVGHI